ncbi:hypothetical protein C0Q70_04594 [Pomacea canaliculata]|uniref:DH domain-containing protein n=1 Tax=Pomacea canaliculata TaxID=400727 RepID=A0A2T7PIX2_POMCA|nr:hypothetical protein C0Q70_04594 [Pomacea canaliculata]
MCQHDKKIGLQVFVYQAAELEPDLGDGVSFAASPAETEVQENLKREQRRCEIIKELIEAEKTYLNHLDIIHKFFYFPLQFNWIIPGDTHSHLFSNIEEINKVNRTLLEVMEQSTVGQAFRHLGPFLKVYATYVNNHEQALAVLQEWRQKKPEFADFITKQESRPELMKLSIKDLLIMPVQQIPRYRLLLEDLLEHTHKNHPDYLQLKEATIQMEKIVKHMNESMRQKENSQKMLAIQKCFDSSAPQILQPGRLFLKEGPLKKITCKEERLVLFSEEIGVAQSWSDAIEMAIRKAKRDFLTLKKTQQSQDTSTAVNSNDHPTLGQFSSDESEFMRASSVLLPSGVSAFCIPSTLVGVTICL